MVFRDVPPVHELHATNFELALIGCVAYVWGKEQSDFGDTIMELLQVASTLWPISFAAVLGPFLKTVALYRAEKGSTLGSLEFLLTSQTTAAAMKNLVMLGPIQIWTICVVLVWSLSPLGGQAAVRSLHLHPNVATTETPVLHYLGGNISDLNLFYNSTGDMGIFMSGSGKAQLISEMRAIVAASFLTTDAAVTHANGSSVKFDTVVESLGGRQPAARLAQRDLWRNVRIPFMQLLPDYNAENPNAWIEVPSDEIVSPASLIGVPVRGGSFNRAGNSTFLVNSRYQTVSCGDDFNMTDWLENGSKLQFHDTGPNASLNYDTGGGKEVQNGPYPNIFFDTVNDTTALGHLNHTYYEVIDTEPPSKLGLIIGGICDEANEPTMMLRRCDLSTSYIDIEVSCVRPSSVDELGCQAARVRHTPGFPISGNLTAMSAYLFTSLLIFEMPFTTAAYRSSRGSLLEWYLKDPPMVSFRGTSDSLSRRPGCFSDVPRHAFEARLATALNTFIMATYNNTVLTGGDGISIDDRNAMWYHKSATWTEFTSSVYVVEKPWFYLFLLSTAILFFCALANVAIRWRSRAPDFLGSVDGLTRDSPFIDVPQEGSGMSGCDRLHTIKGVRVRISDVEVDSEVGRIALTTNVNGPELDWGRKYS